MQTSVCGLLGTFLKGTPYQCENLTFEPCVCADICVWAVKGTFLKGTPYLCENLTFEPCVCADICVWAARNLPERYTLSVWKPYFRALRLCRHLCVGCLEPSWKVHPISVKTLLSSPASVPTSVCGLLGTFLKGTPYLCENLTFEPCVCADICVWAVKGTFLKGTPTTGKTLLSSPASVPTSVCGLLKEHSWKVHPPLFPISVETLLSSPASVPTSVCGLLGTFLKGTPYQCENLTFKPCVCADICVWAARNLPERYTHHWENLTFEPCVCADICVWAARNLPERYTHHYPPSVWKPYFRALRLCRHLCVGCYPLPKFAMDILGLS